MTFDSTWSLDDKKLQTSLSLWRQASLVEGEQPQTDNCGQNSVSNGTWHEQHPRGTYGLHHRETAQNASPSEREASTEDTKHHTRQSIQHKSPHQATRRPLLTQSTPTTCRRASAVVLCDTSGSPPRPKFAPRTPPGSSIQPPHVASLPESVTPHRQQDDDCCEEEDSRKASYRRACAMTKWCEPRLVALTTTEIAHTRTVCCREAGQAQTPLERDPSQSWMFNDRSSTCRQN